MDKPPNGKLPVLSILSLFLLNQRKRKNDHRFIFMIKSYRECTGGPYDLVPRPIFRVSSRNTSKRIARAKYIAFWVLIETRDSVLFKQRKTKASHRLISTFCFYMYLDLGRQVFTFAALMLAPQFIVAQVCTLGS